MNDKERFFFCRMGQDASLRIDKTVFLGILTPWTGFQGVKLEMPFNRVDFSWQMFSRGLVKIYDTFDAATMSQLRKGEF